MLLIRAIISVAKKSFYVQNVYFKAHLHDNENTTFRPLEIL